MTADIIKAEFGRTVQNRQSGFVRDLKNMSALVSEMSLYHSEIRAMRDWKSTVTGKAHRFLIFSYTDDYGLDPTARCGIDRAEEYIAEISECSDEIFLAVTRLDEPFEAQWPREKAGYTLADFQNSPVDLRFKKQDEVVRHIQFGNEEPS
jgi:hypothetical protein